MTRPCVCDNTAACRVCWLYANDPRYRERWGGPPAVAAGPALRPYSTDCTLRGRPTGEVIPCNVCGGRRRAVPVYSCPVAGRCTVEAHTDRNPGAPRWCRTCKEKCQMRWSYGVMTVPARRGTTLPRTLASLRAAGFDRPHLFVDGCDDTAGWMREFGLDVTGRWPKVKTGGNWALSLGELYALEPTADRYALFQDDFVTVRNVRAYLERTPYPDRGYLNLMAFPENEAIAPAGCTGFHPSRQTGRGAVALVFTREAVQVVLTHPHLVGRFADVTNKRHQGWKSIDGGVLESFKKAGWKEYIHAPSLVLHTGTVSSMGNRPHPVSRTFPGEGFDALSLLGEGK